jgi:hypothetical protein
LEIKLKQLANVIVACWDEAEKKLPKLFVHRHPDPSEEWITESLAGELREAIANASKARTVERAFLEDLRSQIPGFSHTDAAEFAGLIASVNPHSKHHEGKVSAADLGLVIIRPQVRLAGWGGDKIECSRDHATGLLAQAKLGHQKKRSIGYRWNRLQPNQEELFPKHRDYFSLLLYRLKGESANELEAIRWQLCRESTVEDVKSWLRLGSFPEEIPSSDVLRKLFDRRIGTENPEIIKTVIAPDISDPHVIEIHISWPPRLGPPPSYCLRQKHHQQEIVQKVYQ